MRKTAPPDMDRLSKFLDLVRTADFHIGGVPKVWLDQYREAFSGGLVSIYFGGSICLSEKGHEHLKASREAIAANKVRAHTSTRPACGLPPPRKIWTEWQSARVNPKN